MKYLMILLPVAVLSMGAMRTLYTAPVTDVSRNSRVNGGYLVREVIYGSRVAFAASDWKTMPRGYLLDPETGASFRFAGRAFGGKFRTFLIWGYTASEHQWARALNEISDHDEKQARFLREWVDRALRRLELDTFDNLGLAHTALYRGEDKAIFYPLALSPSHQRVNIRHETIGAYRFAITDLSTITEGSDTPLSLDTTIYIAGFRHRIRMDDWSFFGAYSHIPTHLPPDQKDKLRGLFRETLTTLSLNPPNE